MSKFGEMLKTLSNIPHKHLSFRKENNRYIFFFEPKENIDIDFAESKMNNVYKIVIKEE